MFFVNWPEVAERQQWHYLHLNKKNITLVSKIAFAKILTWLSLKKN